MPKKRKETYYIAVVFGGLKGSMGLAEHEDNKFNIRIRRTDSMIEQMGTLFHEFAHVAFWIMFNRMDEVREHKFCDAMDRYSKKMLRRYLNGR